MKKNLLLLILVPLLAGFGHSALAENKEIAFFGTVVTRPCTLEPQSAEQSVDMGSVIVKYIYRNQHTVPVPFSINLTDCKTSVFKSVNVTFTGIEDQELLGKLAINDGKNGVAIALFDREGNEILLGKPTKATQLDNGSNVLQFSAYVEGRPSAIKNQTITEGSFSSVANFLLAYE